jgi:hypothetical protein
LSFRFIQCPIPSRIVLLAELIELVAVFLADLVAVVGGIVRADLEGERDIAERQERDAVRMPRHHRRGGPGVGHSRPDLVDAVAAGRVAEDVDAIGIHPLEDNQVLDESGEQAIDVRLVPEVPGVGRGPRAQVDPFLDRIELRLVAPLRVVDRLRRSAAAVKRQPQAPAGGRLLAERLRLEWHLELAVLELLLLHLFGPVLAEKDFVGLPEEVAGLFRVGLRERHRREVLLREIGQVRRRGVDRLLQLRNRGGRFRRLGGKRGQRQQDRDQQGEDASSHGGLLGIVNVGRAVCPIYTMSRHSLPTAAPCVTRHCLADCD